MIDTQFPLKSYAGCNRLYNRKGFTFYYLLNINNNVIHTNNSKFYHTAHERKINSTSSRPNEKYKISRMLSDIFYHQQILPSRIRRKYFGRIRTLLIKQLQAIRSRESQLGEKNRKTKTFFRFSYKMKQMYIGIYRGCHCRLPATFVMSKNRFRCPYIFTKFHIRMYRKKQNRKMR